ncbi:MAG: ptpA 10 [Gemmataceae bacterium]|nr:ptpA 10 [Gemmataceae bacterium]
MRLPLPRCRAATGAALLALLALAADRLAAQPPPPKRVLTHADYDVWRSASGMTLSRDGTYAAYTVAPMDGTGDGEVVVRHLPSGKETRVIRGGRPAEDTPTVPGRFAATGSPQFSPNTAKVVFPLSPTKAEVEKAKAAKAKPDEMPRPVLAVMDLPSGEITARLPYEKAFVVGGDGAGFLIYHKPGKVEPKTDTPDGKTETPPGVKGPRSPMGKRTEPGGGVTTAPAPRPVRTFGTDLVVRDLATGGERVVADVTDYSLTKDGKLLVYAVASKKEDTNGVYVFDPTSAAEPAALKAGSGRYTRLVWDEKQTRLAFFYDSAGVTTDPRIAPPPRPVGTPPTAVPELPPKWHVFVWDRSSKSLGKPIASVPLGSGGGLSAVLAAGVAAKSTTLSPAAEVLGPDTAGQRAGWGVSGNALTFSADGNRVFVATAPVRDPTPPVPASTSPSPDKVELDLWHWKDGYVQPMQKIRGDVERNRTYSAVVFLDTREFRQVADEGLQVGLPAVGDWAVGSDDRKYLHLTGYAYPVPRDYSLVNVRTGERKPALTAFGGLAALSPTGKYLLTFDGKDWSTVSVPDGKKTNLTAGLKVKFFDEEDDHPSEPPAYGLAGWSSDGKFVLVYDRYDIWKLAADGTTTENENLTRIGRPQQVRFRYLNVRAEGDTDDDDRKGIDLSKPLLLSAENLHTRDTGFYRLDPGGTPRLLVMGARRYGPPVRAKNADTYLLTVQTFSDYPDYFATGPDFHELKRVTAVNPKAREYNWGRAELMHYKSADGVPLSGILIKPENFDPAKKYPMVVYIYERLSENLHQFRVPNVTRGQVINPTFYASNGYLVLMPDIAYKVGAPGQSALKCVLPAVQAVADKGYVDEKAIGINGQSWGGYQIAYMVTQTNRFKAAAAGAPVSDMVSAYGGIRWGTGLPRQFQYERSQSRIGETLWKAPMRYIENSPIFMADRVETPLLMIHNDQDDAVPWYQGIEYFLALRRLGKECYLLNYNGEPHNLAKKANARDFAVRMFQFFEHHLKGKPAPEWMVKGVPFVDREKEKEQIKGLLAPAKK